MIVVIITIIIGVIIFKNSTKDSFLSYTISKQDISDKLLLAGTINAQQRVDLGFASSGRIKSVNYNVGDTVKKGSVIAEIEQNRLSADLAQAQANATLTRVETATDVNSATESLEKQIQEQNILVEGLYREYLNGDLQAYNIDDRSRAAAAPVITGNYNNTVEGEYLLDVYSSKASSGFSFVLSGLEKGTYTAENQKPGPLGENGLFIQLIPRESYGNSLWSVPIPNTRSSGFASRKRAYETALATRDRIINELENNLDRVSARDEESEITRDEARRAQARAQVNAVAAQLSDGKIRAPFDGIIARHDLEVGQIVSAFSNQITMFADTTKILKLNTPEIYINKINLGDTVDIQIDAYPEESFQGIVSFIDVIDTEVDGVPVYETDIILNNSDDRIRIGMNARASIIADKKESVIAIPIHYISTNNGVQSVLIRLSERPTKTEKRIITTGFKGNSGLIEVISGLIEGEIILLEEK